MTAVYRNRRRPLKPIGYVFVPLAFWLTRAKPVFDYFCPEKTKFKYRVDGREDAEPVAELAQDKHG